MPNLRDIRRRIRSAKNIQQITRAMKFVSAARLRRAQERVVAARPYARQMLSVLNSLATRVPEHAHPLLAQRGDQKIELVVITADKGLCGAYNTNILKEAIGFLAGHSDKSVELNILGKRARDFFRRRAFSVRHEAISVLSTLSFADAAAIAADIIQEFEKEKKDQVLLVYNEFKSVVQQRVVVEPLLPIQRLKDLGAADRIDYLYDEPPERIFNNLLPRHVETQIFRALLEAAAAEHGARMTAMDAATRNATEMIENLTLFANKVRQAGITRELIEIVSGASST
ncbi:MAG: ATP synthase F1 subunit gamma [Acidobacteria bacterium]|nr:MAG: ATP synthase F1 subunit gamma [Acidobacteriota bacterium]PYU99924.1 MAG: ATP synthase F1 subunit gamma [Acidobacteriota bacterium]PYV38482.1 MAG: ATP synthase F1 subunit gamma [Acidobacteriota bacterium]